MEKFLKKSNNKDSTLLPMKRGQIALKILSVKTEPFTFKIYQL